MEEIRRDALRIFGAVDGYGLSRVDFFIEDGTGEVVFNEINTMPGFTSISMYPMLFEAQGFSILTAQTRTFNLPPDNHFLHQYLAVMLRSKFQSPD